MTKAGLQFYTGCAQEESQPHDDNIYFTVPWGALNAENGGGFSLESTLVGNFFLPIDSVPGAGRVGCKSPLGEEPGKLKTFKLLL